MKKLYTLLLICAFSLSVYPDDVKRPDLQIADNSFFDPTAKKKVEESYHFGVEYRIEAGYVQHEQRTRELSYPQLFLHGVRVGATFTFRLPLHFGVQTGLYYTAAFGKHEQHWRSMSTQATQEEIIDNRVIEHNLTIPARVYYTIPLWRELNLFFFTGLQVHVGLAESCYVDSDNLTPGTKEWLIKQGVHTENYDRMVSDRHRVNAQWGLGGGLEWDKYRLQSGYDFGLNNLARPNGNTHRYMAEWGWFVSFCIRLK